jgi:hypothetical protein
MQARGTIKMNLPENQLAWLSLGALPALLFFASLPS